MEKPLKKKKSRQLDRRDFFKGAAIVGGSAIVSPLASEAATIAGVADRAVRSAIRPTYKMALSETAPPQEGAVTDQQPGSDFMVDVIKSIGFDFVATNPASGFRGLHESLIDYGADKSPELLTCTHEEISVAMAHGYFKITGKPMLALCHGSVGLQHAAMAIYNAWCDRVPVIVLAGNDLDAAERPPGTPTRHSAQDVNALCRDFTKWDDTPVSLPHFAQSFVRAYKIAMTPAHEPVALVVDAGLQESVVADKSKLQIPRYVPASPPAGDVAAVREAAKLLAAAEAPVIVVDRAARTPNGLVMLVQLAELLQAPVVDLRGRMNFPNTHYLYQSARRGSLIAKADVIIGLELTDFWGIVNAFIDNGEHGRGLQEVRMKPDAKLISINSVDLNTKSNYQDFQRFQTVDVAMAADAEATLPYLIEALKSALGNDRAFALQRRQQVFQKAFAENVQQVNAAAAVAWDASPISTARLTMEIWAQIKDLDYSLVSDEWNIPWFSKLWRMEKYHNYIGGSGGGGQGYGMPGAVGAALGNRGTGRISINVQGDGDLLYSSNAIWTAARHNIPLLTIMHNNRGYHQEVMHVQRMSNRRQRVANLGRDFGPIGTSIQNPDVDFAKLASSLGAWSVGPIKNPAELAPTIKTAIEIVKSGAPALIDVWTQPR
jgi:acetolactate synthase-1/2/3 large subunit